MSVEEEKINENEEGIESSEEELIVNKEEAALTTSTNKKQKIEYFPKNKILKILKELKMHNSIDDLDGFSLGVEEVMKEFIKESVYISFKKGRKTLFISDLEECIKERNFFFLNE